MTLKINNIGAKLVVDLWFNPNQICFLFWPRERAVKFKVNKWDKCNRFIVDLFVFQFFFDISVSKETTAQRLKDRKFELIKEYLINKFWPELTK